MSETKREGDANHDKGRENKKHKQDPISKSSVKIY